MIRGGGKASERSQVVGHRLASRPRTGVVLDPRRHRDPLSRRTQPLAPEFDRNIEIRRCPKRAGHDQVHQPLAGPPNGIHPQARRGIRVSRIARGVPLGGELEYVDAGTISQALLDRRGI